MEIKLTKQNIEDGVSIILEGLPGHPQDKRNGLEIAIEGGAGLATIRVYSGSQHPLIEKEVPYFEVGDAVVVSDGNGEYQGIVEEIKAYWNCVAVRDQDDDVSDVKWTAVSLAT